MDTFLNDSNLRYLQSHHSVPDQRRLIIPPGFLSALNLGPNSLLHTLNTPLSLPLHFPSDISNEQAGYYDRNLERPFHPRALPLHFDKQFVSDQHAHGACFGCSGPARVGNLMPDTGSDSDSEGVVFYLDLTGGLDISSPKEVRAKSKSKSKSKSKLPFNDTDSDGSFDKHDLLPPLDGSLFLTEEEIEEKLQRLLDKFADSGFKVGKADPSRAEGKGKGKMPDTDVETKAYVRGYNDAVKDMALTKVKTQPETDPSMVDADLVEWHNGNETAQEKGPENSCAREDLSNFTVVTLDAARHLDSPDSQAQD